jgi:EAL domain-containing protein (putative c-di-GMP-specific phosphodiesterase class I)
VRDLGADAGQGWHLGRPVVERTAWQSWCHGVAVDA